MKRCEPQVADIPPKKTVQKRERTRRHRDMTDRELQNNVTLCANCTPDRQPFRAANTICIKKPRKDRRRLVKNFFFSEQTFRNIHSSPLSITQYPCGVSPQMFSRRNKNQSAITCSSLHDEIIGFSMNAFFFLNVLSKYAEVVKVMIRAFF